MVRPRIAPLPRSNERPAWTKLPESDNLRLDWAAYPLDVGRKTPKPAPPALPILVAIGWRRESSTTASTRLNSQWRPGFQIGMNT